MMTSTCLMGVLVWPSLLPLCDDEPLEGSPSSAAAVRWVLSACVDAELHATTRHVPVNHHKDVRMTIRWLLRLLCDVGRVRGLAGAVCQRNCASVSVPRKATMASISSSPRGGFSPRR